MNATHYQVSADVGGTFTDLVLLEAGTGRFLFHKVPSIPTDPAAAVLQGVREICARGGVAPAAVDRVVHGFTIGLNAVLTRRGARVGLLVSRGFRDVMELARLRLPEPLLLTPRKEDSLVPRYLVQEVGVRVLASGQVLTAPDPDDVKAAVERLLAAGVESIAIALLHSYANPEPEREVARIAASFAPGVPISASSTVWPEIREYERTSVVVLNAYTQAIVGNYLTRLESGLAALQVPGRLYVTSSNGGVMTAGAARDLPVQTLFSGPSSGVEGARWIAQLAGCLDAFTVDIGGTSADMSLIRRGVAGITTEATIDHFPLIMPMVDIASIGTGGGSIAWLDDLGVLKVGPQSAGADPGPACYGWGGLLPTVSDAYLLCGFLDPASFSGGRFVLRPDLAREAMAPLARRIGRSIVETAEAILTVATANMATEAGLVMARKGLDPREFAMMPFGGAGPTHACLLAEETGLHRIIVAPSPGTLCALGAMITAVRRDYIRTVQRELPAIPEGHLSALFAEMETEAAAWLSEQELAAGATGTPRYIRALDMRYRGEPHDTEVVLPPDTPLTAAALTQLLHEFHAALYRFSDLADVAVVTNLRVRLEAPVSMPPPAELPARMDTDLQAAPCHIRQIYYRGTWHDAAIWNRSDLRTGQTIAGAAVVQQPDTTVVILPGFEASADRYGILTVTRTGG